MNINTNEGTRGHMITITGDTDTTLTNKVTRLNKTMQTHSPKQQNKRQIQRRETH